LFFRVCVKVGAEYTVIIDYMISGFLTKFKKRKIVVFFVLLIIIGVGYFGYGKIKNEDNVLRYAMAYAQRGSLITSVSGNGQIDVSDKSDIKSEVSGKIIALYIKKGQDVKKGTLVAVIDTWDAQMAVNDAELALESAKIKLEELLSPPNAQELLKAENSLSQAERDLEKARENYENIEIGMEKTLANAYEDGYSDVSSAFFRLAGYMENLRNVIGTEDSDEKYVNSYKLLLGENSLFIKNLLNNYYIARDLYNESFAFFRSVSRQDDRDEIYDLINETIKTTKAIFLTQESARHMYDAIIIGSYKEYNISSTIDKMRPKIESDLSSIVSVISSLQKTADVIDETIKDTPSKIKDSKLSLQFAEEKLEEKKLAIDDINSGVDSMDIKYQKNNIAQKEATLLNARNKLYSHYVRAPFDGIITEFNMEVGDSASSGTVLATLMTKQYIAKLTLNEIDIAKVKLSQPVTLTFDAVEGLTLTGKVSDISSSASTNQGLVTYGVTIILDTVDEKIKSGMSITAAIITNAKLNVLLIPNSAVKSQNGVSYVEVPNVLDRTLVMANIGGVALDNPIDRQNIEVGEANDEFIEVVNGLDEGDLVITRTIQTAPAQNTQAQQSPSVQIPGLNVGGTGGFRAR
jgi:RND family efflux transporter MFP subunit